MGHKSHHGLDAARLCGSLCMACEVSKSQESAVMVFAVEKALRTEFAASDGIARALEIRAYHGVQYMGSDCDAFWR